MVRCLSMKEVLCGDSIESGQHFMLEKFLKPLSYAGNLPTEIQQSREEGKDVSSVESVAKVIYEGPKIPQREKAAGAIFDRLAREPVVESFRYVEPSDLASIKAARPKHERIIHPPEMENEKMYDKVYGAWLGRTAGVLLGQPVEGWRRDRIVGLLKDIDNHPINYYLSSDIPQKLRDKYQVVDKPGPYGSPHKNWINNIDMAPKDDDTDYTILGLKILEQYGADFQPVDVAETWLSYLPARRACTAERVAYKNLMNGKLPPESATYRNPFREWIGAQIRGDFFGYITPGKPELAADMAWRDASISHTKNGIYGEMNVAAMLSTAAVTSNMEEIIRGGLAQIPEKSRLTEGIDKVLQWKREGITWQQALDRIHDKYDEKIEHDWCHTISNAMIVDVALLYGDLDLGKTVGIAVMAGFDTDCNAGTAGSIVGMVVGAEALPQKWTAPLNDQLRTNVEDGKVNISDLAKRTMDIYKRHPEFSSGSHSQ
jgi:ADP-ribosylglycohydrolase